VDVMSWDIFVQDLPDDIQSVRDIPPDFVPKSLRLSRAALIELITRFAPEVDFSDPAWGVIDRDGLSIEVNLGHAEQVKSFAFHVRGGGDAVGLIAAILDKLQLRAIDPLSASGLFELDGSRHRSVRPIPSLAYQGQTRYGPRTRETS